jgi:hypothetical protein
MNPGVRKLPRFSLPSPRSSLLRALLPGSIAQRSAPRTGQFPGLRIVPRLSWRQRQPAVLGASMLLAVFLSVAGIDPEDLRLAPFLLLAGTSLGLLLAGNGRPRRK